MGCSHHRKGLPTRCAFLCALTLLLACGPAGGPDTRAITRRDSAGIAITQNDLERLEATCQLGDSPTVTIGTTEGDEEYELFRVFGARRLSDGTIALVNGGSQQVRFYDQRGRFIGQAGRAGEGPGEFRDAFYLWALPGDTIWVGDYRPYRFLVFGPDRQWMETVQPEPMYVNPPNAVVLDGGRSVLAEQTRQWELSADFELSYLEVMLHGPDGALIDTVGTYPDGRWGRMEHDQSALVIYPFFESFTRLTGTGSHIVIGHMSRAEFFIYAAADEIRLEHIVRWTTGDRTISAAEIDAERQRMLDQYEDMDAAMRRRLLAPLVSKDRPVADRFPAFAGLEAGRDGRIWVRDYPRPSAPGPDRWIAFDSEGRFQCRTTMPKFDELLEFGAEYVLVKDVDDLGIERVLQYPLSPPAAAE